MGEAAAAVHRDMSVVLVTGAGRGSYAEAARAIVQLAATPYMTGQVVTFDGGLSLA